MNIHKPSWLPAEAWGDFVKKYVRDDGMVPCVSCGTTEARMSVDHILPRIRGGTHVLDNLQPMCISCNSAKGPRPDGYWGKKKYFDDGLNVGMLRESQRSFVCDPIEEYREFFGRPWSSINGRLFLFAQIVGAGKTLGMFALPFALNKCMPHDGPRVDKMLIVTKDEALRSQTAGELREEAVQFDLVSDAPIVREIESSKDLFDTDPHDIAVMCRNLLWPTLGEDKTDVDRMHLENLAGVIPEPGIKWRKQVDHVIENYPLIIFDEMHYAHRNIIHFLKVAQNSLVFGFTASPVDHRGELFDELVRMSTYGYREACVHDKSMKWIGNSIEDVLEVVKTDDIETLDGWAGTSDVPVTRKFINVRAVVTSAVKKVHELDRFPQEPRLAPHRPDDKFVLGGKVWQHAIIAVETVDIAEDVVKFLNRMFNANRSKFPLNEGWRASIAHSRADKPFDDRHPFFRYKNSGKMSRECSRFLVVVDMAAEGMNNRYVGVLAMAKKCRSIREWLQRIGRLIRSAHSFNGKADEVPPAAFDTIHIITHEVFENVPPIREAWEFMKNMGGSLAALMGIEQYAEEGYVDTDDAGNSRCYLTYEDTIRIMFYVGKQKLAGNPLSKRSVTSMFKGASAKRKNLAFLDAQAVFNRIPEQCDAAMRTIFKADPPTPLLNLAIDDVVHLDELMTVEDCLGWLEKRDIPHLVKRNREDLEDPGKRADWIAGVNELNRFSDTQTYRSGQFETQNAASVLDVLADWIVGRLQLPSAEYEGIRARVGDLAIDYLQCAGPTEEDFEDSGRLDIPPVVFELRDSGWQGKVARHITYLLALEGKLPNVLEALEIDEESLLAEGERY